MLQRVKVEGIQFPRLYIAENMEDVEVAKANGIPYVKWRYGQDKLVKMLLRPTLEKMFPGINWNKVLGRRKTVASDAFFVPSRINDSDQEIAEYDHEKMLAAQLEHDNVVDKVERVSMEHVEGSDGVFTRSVDIAEDRRDCVGGTSDDYSLFWHDAITIEDYVGDLSSNVDIEALSKLGLLPKFMGDVADCIKVNLSQSMRWTEGYTKKLGYPLGKFKCKQQLPNLVIIDCSHSIPDGIAATMLTLADTLRSVCNAELIITSYRSGYYPVGAELPSPQTLRDYYGRSNESVEFMTILANHIAGREFGHVISFGDNDCPGRISEHYDYRSGKYGSIDMTNTKVHAVHHYHTSFSNTPTGYAKWVDEVCPEAEHHYDTSWCNVMNRRYKF